MEIARLPGPPSEDTATSQGGTPPPNPESAATDGAKRQQRGRRGQKRPRTRDELLDAMEKLFSLVALGVLTTVQANTMRAILDSLLKHQQPTQHHPANGRLDVTELRRIFREQPLLFDLLAPLLSNEMLDEIMRDPEE